VVSTNHAAMEPGGRVAAAAKVAVLAGRWKRNANASADAARVSTTRLAMAVERGTAETSLDDLLRAETDRHVVEDQWQGLTLVPISAQLELLCPPLSKSTHECVLELLKLSSNVNECSPW